jgi:L-histidine N-alpha-methyltransferase
MHEWVDIGLRSLRQQTIALPLLGVDVSFAEGVLRIEVSSKFRRAGIEAELSSAGLLLERWWTDVVGDFALVLARRAG